MNLANLLINTIKAAFKKETLMPAGATPKLVKRKSVQITLEFSHLPTVSTTERVVKVE